MTKWNREEVQDFVNQELKISHPAFRFELLSMDGKGGIVFQIKPLEIENPEYFESIKFAEDLLSKYGLNGLE